MRYYSKHSKETRLERLFNRIPASLQRPAVLGVTAIVGVGLILSPALIKDSSGSAAGAAVAPAAPLAEAITQVAPQAAATMKVAPEAAPTETARKARPKSEVVGFYVNWDETSYQSLSKNIDTLTIVMPEWYHLTENGRLIKNNAKAQAKAMQLIRRKRPDLRVMPIVNNFGPDTDPQAMAKLLKKPSMRRKMARDIVRTMRAGGFEGINIDFEGLPNSARKDLVLFMKTLYPMAKKAKLEVSQDVIVGSATYDHRRLARNVDYLIPMMYDEHWKGSGPGPIASQGWYERTLKRFFKIVPPNKVVIAVGTYSYDWSSQGGKARALTYPKALSLAKQKRRTIKLDKRSLNATFSYKAGRVRHQVWMLNAVTTFNQVKAASRHKPRGYAVWRLGGEDQAMWRVLANRDKLDSRTARSLKKWGRSVAYDADRKRIVGERVKP